MSGTVTRTIEFILTPEEAAASFAHMDGEEQAKFFAEVWRIAKGWPGAGWCMQSYEIARRLDADGREAIATLAGHVLEPSND